MARSFSVYLAKDLEFIAQPPVDDVYSEVFEAWEAECLRRRLYEDDLGSESAIRLYWSEPAERLGLSRLASMYDVGFDQGCSWSRAELDAVTAELDALTTYWRDAGIEAELRVSLEARAESLRRGIRIARESAGVVLVT